jgi:hypothetical protein
LERFVRGEWGSFRSSARRCPRASNLLASAPSKGGERGAFDDEQDSE